jgi:hypothetical protein
MSHDDAEKAVSPNAEPQDDSLTLDKELLKDLDPKVTDAENVRGGAGGNTGSIVFGAAPRPTCSA